jgi:hypothetical protein
MTSLEKAGVLAMFRIRTPVPVLAVVAVVPEPPAPATGTGSDDATIPLAATSPEAAVPRVDTPFVDVVAGWEEVGMEGTDAVADVEEAAGAGAPVALPGLRATGRTGSDGSPSPAAPAPLALLLDRLDTPCMRGYQREKRKGKRMRATGGKKQTAT